MREDFLEPRNPILAMPGLAVAIDAFDSNFASSGADLVSSIQNLGNQGAADAVQATGTRQPKFVAGAINGCPAFQGRHDGTNASQLTIADSAALDYSGFSLFVVFQRSADLGAEENIVAKYTGTTEFRCGITNADAFSLATSSSGAGVTDTATTSTTSTLDTPYIGEGHYLNATSISSRLNGGFVGTDSSVASVANGTALFEIFCRNNAVPFAGHVGAVYFFNRTLSDNEIVFVRKTLSRRWRIPTS